MYSNKGVTMIQMVITIIMMVLIAGFSIYNSSDTIVEIKLSKTYEEMKEVKNAVTSLKILEEDLTNYLGTPLEDLSSYHQLEEYYNRALYKEFYYLDFKNQGDVLCDILEIRNIENNYIINTGNIEDIEIFLVNGLKINGEIYYTDDEILEKYNDIFTGR